MIELQDELMTIRLREAETQAEIKVEKSLAMQPKKGSFQQYMRDNQKSVRKT